MCTSTKISLFLEKGGVRINRVPELLEILRYAKVLKFAVSRKGGL